MADRIYPRDLGTQIDYLNRLAGLPTEPYEETPEGVRPVPGVFTLSSSYGGYALHRISNQGGGVLDVFQIGHVKARELHGRLAAYIKAIEDVRYGRIGSLRLAE
jgi:hypothetical protein